MSGEPRPPVRVPAWLQKELCVQARRAFPAECVGWMTGPREAAEVDNIRPCTNVIADEPAPFAIGEGRGAETAYNIGGDDLRLLALAEARSSSPPRIIYHSHPNGRAYFSAMDQEAAAAMGGPAFDVQHLVIGIDAERRVTEMALFDWSEAEGRYVEIDRFGPPE